MPDSAHYYHEREFARIVFGLSSRSSLTLRYQPNIDSIRGVVALFHPDLTQLSPGLLWPSIQVRESDPLCESMWKIFSWPLQFLPVFPLPQCRLELCAEDILRDIPPCRPSP